MNLVVLHKLADLRTAGDAGSRAARIAEGLDRRRLDPSRLPPGREPGPAHAPLLGLSESEAQLISTLSAGQALWRVGARSFVVQHYRSGIETQADRHRHRDAVERREGRSRMNSRRRRPRVGRRPARCDRCALAVAGTLWVWGGLAGALFGAAGPASDAGQLLGVSHRGSPRASATRGAWPARRALAICRARPGFYATLMMLARRRRCRPTIAAGRSAAGSAGAGWRTLGENAELRQPRAACGRSRRQWSATRARAPRRQAAARRGTARAGRLRPTAVGQVGRHRDPGAARLGGPAVASSIKTDLVRATIARRRALGEVFVFDPFGLSGVRGAHVVATPHRRHLGRRARGRLAPRLGRRARPPQRRGRRLLGCRRRTTARAAPVRRGVNRGGHGHRRALVLRPGNPRPRPGAAVAPPPRAALPTRTPPTTPCERSRPRPTGHAPRSRRPRRRCCARTGSRASRAQPNRARSRRTGCSTRRRRST